MRWIESAWEVIQEVLRKAEGPLHYTEISRLVINSGRSRLGRRGQTPSQTVGMVMRKMPERFCHVGKGLYDLQTRRIKLQACVSPERGREVFARLLNCWDHETSPSAEGKLEEPFRNVTRSPLKRRSMRVVGDIALSQS